jgi:hypothetical protein
MTRWRPDRIVAETKRVYRGALSGQDAPSSTYLGATRQTAKSLVQALNP